MSDQTQRPTVLVVDDEPLIAQLVQETLEAAGFAVILAIDHAEAVAAIDGRTDELAGLVTDINLGAGPTGWDVATRAREMIPDIPVVYVTGDSSHQWPSSGVPHSLVVTKPFAPAQIVVALSGLANKTDLGA